MKQKFLFLGLAFAAGCAGTPADEESSTYRMRANPGPGEWSTEYAFARNGLTIRARGEKSGDEPVFYLNIKNHSGARVLIHESMITIRGGNPVRSLPAELRDHTNSDVTKIMILARDELQFSVRPRQVPEEIRGGLVLEVRGLRDDAGDGGYDFDLFAEPLAVDGGGARGTHTTGTEAMDDRREIRDTNSIQTPTKKVKP